MGSRSCARDKQGAGNQGLEGLSLAMKKSALRVKGPDQRGHEPGWCMPPMAEVPACFTPWERVTSYISHRDPEVRYARELLDDIAKARAKLKKATQVGFPGLCLTAPFNARPHAGQGNAWP